MPMTHTDRARQHRVCFVLFVVVLVVAGTVDQALIYHDRTLIERARLMADEYGSHASTERGLEALDRLVRAGEEGELPHRRESGQFFEAVCNNKPMALAILRAVDRRTADDMLDGLDAWRWARVNLAEGVKGGPRRIATALRACRA